MKKDCACLKRGHHVGLFLLALFGLCFLGYYLRPEQELHVKILQMMFFGFSGMNLLSFILGAVQTFIWGYILSALWCLTGCCCGKDKCEK